MSILDIDGLSLFEGNKSCTDYLGEADGEADGEAADVKVTVSILSRRNRCTFA